MSARAMSTTCPGCHKAIKIEDIVVKSYVPVVDLQTCGRIRIAKRGRVAAKRLQCGDGLTCDGAIEGAIETDGDVRMGPKSSWKGKTLMSRSLEIAAGAKLVGVVTVPWHRPPAPTSRKKTGTGNAVATAPSRTGKVLSKAAAVTTTKAVVKKVTRKKTLTTRTIVTKKKTAAKAVARKVAKKIAAKKTAAKKKKKK